MFENILAETLTRIGQVTSALLSCKAIILLYEWVMGRTLDEKGLCLLQDHVFYATPVNGVSTPQPQPVTEEEMCRSLNWKRTRVRRALSRLRRGGKVTARGGVWYYKPK